MRRRVLAVVVLVSLVTMSLVGCNSGENRITTGEMEELEPITFVFYSADGSEDPWTDPIAQEITKATGVTLETDYPVDGDDQKIALMIASQEYPDIIFAKGDGARLIEAGALIDLTELIDQYGPNIKAMYGEYYERLKYSEEDPSIYQLCSTGVGDNQYKVSGNAQLQWAVLEENGYEIPYTLEQYESMIKSYLEKYPTIDGKETIGLSISVSDWHWYTTLSNPSGFIANGSVDNGQWIIDEDNNYTATYKHTGENQKEYFKWLNRMYAEGILDSNFATQTHDDYIEKVASGRVLGLLDADWDYMKAEMSLKSEGKYNRTYAGLPVTLNENITCSTLRDQGLSVGWGIGITTSCKDPVRAIQFIDWLCTEEAQILLNWGIEGVNYYVDENGKRYRTEDEIRRYNEDTNYMEETGVGFHNYPFPTHGIGVLDSTGNTFSLVNETNVKEEYNEEERKALKAWNVEMLTDIFPQKDEFESPMYAPIWSQTLTEEFNQMEAKLDQIAWSGLIDCIVCDPDEFSTKWNQLQLRLESAGREEAEQYLTNLIRKEVEFWKN